VIAAARPVPAGRRVRRRRGNDVREARQSAGGRGANQPPLPKQKTPRCRHEHPDRSGAGLRRNWQHGHGSWIKKEAVPSSTLPTGSAPSAAASSRRPGGAGKASRPRTHVRPRCGRRIGRGSISTFGASRLACPSPRRSSPSGNPSGTNGSRGSRRGDFHSGHNLPVF
jgi:hypothetical protein